MLPTHVQHERKPGKVQPRGPREKAEEHQGSEGGRKNGDLLEGFDLSSRTLSSGKRRIGPRFLRRVCLERTKRITNAGSSAKGRGKNKIRKDTLTLAF